MQNDATGLLPATKDQLEIKQANPGSILQLVKSALAAGQGSRASFNASLQKSQYGGALTPLTVPPASLCPAPAALPFGKLCRATIDSDCLLQKTLPRETSNHGSTSRYLVVTRCDVACCSSTPLSRRTNPSKSPAVDEEEVSPGPDQ